jgi:hypothetical protein
LEKGGVMLGVRELMSGPMGQLNRPIRVRFRDKIKSLLRGQVILSI